MRFFLGILCCSTLITTDAADPQPAPATQSFNIGVLDFDSIEDALDAYLYLSNPLLSELKSTERFLDEEEDQLDDRLDTLEKGSEEWQNVRSTYLGVRQEREQIRDQRDALYRATFRELIKQRYPYIQIVMQTGEGLEEEMILINCERLDLTAGLMQFLDEEIVRLKQQENDADVPAETKEDF